MAQSRMRFHPSDSSRAAMYAVRSFSAGLVGLGFEQDPGLQALCGPAAAVRDHSVAEGIENPTQVVGRTPRPRRATRQRTPARRP
jgi:hypothetical protein